MNIKDAKNELKNIVVAYLAKDENGMPMIPEEHQRPVLLMGPPGIGKTAIMKQIASELGINLVSYTITHHTRQSAIGLPGIVKRNYGGEEVSVTEYTMSEIIASVYDQIERSGIKEGILFLDEINCVSETLAPTMLQFLQFKTFGTHKVPQGFIIVTAGNPPEYNLSVREFDIVTLDRLRRIDIDADFPAFKEYAYRLGLHGAIMAYLEIRKDRFYMVQADTDRKRFVTARGWEDLSDALHTYEKLGLPVTEALMSQYLQDPETASDFAVYYELYRKYESFYQVPEILAGRAGINEELKFAPFDEKLSLIGLLVDALGAEFRAYRDEQQTAERLHAFLKDYGMKLKESAASENAGEAGSPAEVLKAMLESEAAAREQKKRAMMLTHEEESDALRFEKALSELYAEMRLSGPETARDAFSMAAKWFSDREDQRQQKIEETGEHLTNVFKALGATFAEGQEMVLFLSEMNAGYYSLKFVNECGNDEYYRYNKLLLLKDHNESLRREILELSPELG